MADIKVTFRGVRGSHAMPGKNTIEYGGNTTCIEIQAGEERIIFDAGTGIISLGKQMLMEHFTKQMPLNCSLFFSHMHHDHNEGLPFFQPMYIANAKIYMFGPDPLAENIGNVLFQSPYFPVDLKELGALKILQSIITSDVVIFDNGNPRLYNTKRKKIDIPEDKVVVRIMKSYAHPKLGVFLFRLEYKNKSVTFCTDTEGYSGGDTKLITFAKDTDLLIHDAQYTVANYVSPPVPKQGFGHSTPEMAVEVAQKAEVKMLACTHHDPDATDEVLAKEEIRIKELFPNSFYAKDMLVYEI